MMWNETVRRRRWNTQDRQGCRTAFTLIEILVVIGILSVLTALLLPALAQGKATAMKIECFSNLKQIGFGIEVYAADHAETLPGPIWTGQPYDYSLSAQSNLTAYRRTIWERRLLPRS